jgi:hypothetical protein
MRDFFNKLSNKFKSVYIIWILINFILLMLSGGIITSGFNAPIVINQSFDFFPFGRSFIDISDYDYTEFLVYTIVPFFLYYSYWLWNKKNE